jgi:hypothetical protein
MATFEELKLIKEIDEIIEDYVKDKQPLKYTFKSTNTARGGQKEYLYTWQYVPKFEQRISKNGNRVRFEWKYIGGLHNPETRRYLIGVYNETVTEYLEEAREMLKKREQLIDDEMDKNGYYDITDPEKKRAIRLAAGAKIKKKHPRLWKAEEYIEKAKELIEKERRVKELIENFKAKKEK